MDSHPSVHNVVLLSFHRIASSRNVLNANLDSLLSYIPHWKSTTKKNEIFIKFISTLLQLLIFFYEQIDFNENKIYLYNYQCTSLVEMKFTNYVEMIVTWLSFVRFCSAFTEQNRIKNVCTLRMIAKISIYVFLHSFCHLCIQMGFYELHRIYEWKNWNKMSVSIVQNFVCRNVNSK